MDTFHRVTVNADCPAGIHGIGRPVPVLLPEAFAAGIVLLVRIAASHHDIALAAASVTVIGTVRYTAF